MNFDDAVNEFKRLFIDGPKSPSEAEWFYIKGQLDLQAEELKRKGVL